LLALSHHVLCPALAIGAKLRAVGRAVLDLSAVVAHLLALGHPILDLGPVVTRLLAFGHPILDLGPVVANLLALGHASLTLDAIGSNLLALRYATFDPVRPNLLALGHAVPDALGMSRPLRHAFSAELRPLDTAGPWLALDCETLRALAAAAALDRLTWRGAAFDRPGRRSPLPLNLIIGVAAARASRCRR